MDYACSTVSKNSALNSDRPTHVHMARQASKQTSKQTNKQASKQGGAGRRKEEGGEQQQLAQQQLAQRLEQGARSEEQSSGAPQRRASWGQLEPCLAGQSGKEPSLRATRNKCGVAPPPYRHRGYGADNIQQFSYVNPKYTIPHTPTHTSPKALAACVWLKGQLVGAARGVAGVACDVVREVACEVS